MTTTKRTDVHRPSAPEFDPETYTCRGVFDLDPDDGDPRGHMLALNRVIDEGYRRGPGSSRQCGHCGAHLRYSALMVHEPTRTFLHVGETCLDNRFDLTAAEFRALRETARLNRERRTRSERREAYLAEYPDLAILLAEDRPERYGTDFLCDIADTMREARGPLSERQVTAARNAIRRADERQVEQEARAERVCRHLGAVGDKITVTGVVRVHRIVDGYAYNTTQVFMIIETPEGDVKIISAAGWAYDAEQGETVTVVGTVKALGEYAGQSQTVLTRTKRVQS